LDAIRSKIIAGLLKGTSLWKVACFVHDTQLYSEIEKRLHIRMVTNFKMIMTQDLIFLKWAISNNLMETKKKI
jgi:hypothetical protein